MIKSKRLLVPLAVSMALYGGSIAAEEADTDEDSNVIIITASKRPTSLQETPIAITVVSEEAIEQTKIQDIFDLQSLVPTLRVSPLQRSTNTSFSLRGFANGTNNVGIEPSVGVFIDGVYRSRAAAQIGDLPRLEQIEVLSGPQSTLFGKNASAGVINVRTKAPSFDLEGKVEVGVGNFNQQLFKAYVTNSISDNVAFSLSAVSSTRDGYTDSLANGLGKLNDRDRFSLRGQLLWEPSDDVSFRLIADMSEIDEVCCTVANTTNGPVTPILEAFTGGIVLDDATPFAYESALNFNPVNTVEDSGVSLEASVDYDSFNFTSIVSFRTNDSTSVGDVDYSAAD
ncbi:MAG: iron complex outermembrane receptor protein, partial [Polaribacter sp.]